MYEERSIWAAERGGKVETLDWSEAVWELKVCADDIATPTALPPEDLRWSPRPPYAVSVPIQVPMAPAPAAPQSAALPFTALFCSVD
ncbi:hypothetical protein AAFF_G00010070 [Aldrovandia affinis]|uniref:Uncharacterized protein n=1 Tax=Aldrovandia affinis TaxID=143900 RepID=A0AAD7WHN4_9TELE|nr:hypothetical protein AAFF_G00010070 [Aldrovandia affinis]